MGNTIQTFTNDAFGAIRTITGDGQTLFCGKDVAVALGYVNASKALQDHCKGVPFHC
ncbi:BRO family, N-terminal domain [Arcanobacterium haemolyticum]|nr:BRO family, N-terminal domain [Arcanobacterium haemolyticum]